MHKLLRILVLVLSSQADASVCRMHLPGVELDHSIPSKLLHAISIIESGVRQGNQVDSWPWIINANGKPYIFKSKAEAVTKVRQLQRKGVRSIDVGCMQINLKQHPKAFSSLEDAFDPRTNIAYAAKFLSDLKDRLGSWHAAVAHYHSATSSRNIPYKKKVIAVWRSLQGEVGHELPEIQQTVMRIKNSNETSFEMKSEDDVSVRVTFAPYKIPVVPKRAPEKIAQKVPTKTMKAPERIPLANGFFLLNSSGRLSDKQPLVKANFKMRPIVTSNGKFYKLK